MYESDVCTLVDVYEPNEVLVDINVYESDEVRTLDNVYESDNEGREFDRDFNVCKSKRAVSDIDENEYKVGTEVVVYISDVVITDIDVKFDEVDVDVIDSDEAVAELIWKKSKLRTDMDV